MGLFWDLIQQSAIHQQRLQTATLEERVSGLEVDLKSTRELLQTLIQRLEKHVGADLSNDGRIG